ncbi:MAG: AsmA family protein [bacterium]|nr:AsmA family protein [bacterium]
MLAVTAVLSLLMCMALWVMLSRYDYNALKPYMIQLAKHATGRDLILAGDIALKLGMTPTLRVETVRFQNATWSTHPNLLEVKRLEVQIGLISLLRGILDIKRLVLIEPSILIELDPQGRSNLAFEKPQDSQLVKTQLAAISVNDVQIENGTLTFIDGPSDRTYVVGLDRLSATTAGINQALRVELQGTYRQQRFTTSGTLGPLISLIKRNNAWPIQLRTEISGLTLRLDGAIQDPLAMRGVKLNLTAEAKDLKRLDALIEKPLPLQGPFRFSGQIVDSAPKTFQVNNATLVLGTHTLNGSLTVELVKPRPVLTANLSSAKLDLRPFITKARRTGRKKEKVFPAQPLPIKLLQAIEASIKMQIGQLFLPRLVLNNLSFDARITDGRLTIKPIHAVLGGGTLDGHLSLRPTNHAATLTVVMQITRFDLGRMLKELDITDQVEGLLDADIDIKGHGASLAAIMSKLDGSTNIVMGKGQLDNRYIGLLGSDLSAGLLRLINPFKDDKDNTQINCVVSRFNIRDGIAESTALVFDTNNMSVIGAGTIDLKTERLNLSLKPSPKDGVGSQPSGKISLSLSQLAKPFKLGGTLANPSLAIDPGQTALLLGKTVGGIVLFGPLGIATALLSTSAGDDNACLLALESAQQPQQTARPKQQTQKRNLLSKTTQTLKSFGNKLNNLFGSQAAPEADQTETDSGD